MKLNLTVDPFAEAEILKNEIDGMNEAMLRMSTSLPEQKSLNDKREILNQINSIQELLMSKLKRVTARVGAYNMTEQATPETQALQGVLQADVHFWEAAQKKTLGMIIDNIQEQTRGGNR